MVRTMGRAIKNVFKKIPFFEAIRAFLEQWGIWKYLVTGGSLMVAAFYSFWAWLTDHVPVWGIGIIFMLVTCLVLWGFNLAVDAYRKITAERIDHEAISEELIRLSDEMTRAVNDYVREQMVHRRDEGFDEPMNEEKMRRQWEAKSLQDDLMLRHVSERFGRRIIAAVIILKKLDIKIPFHLSHVHASTVMSLASFFGAVGQLIKTGNLSLAQNMDDHTNWEVSGMLR